MSVFAGWASSLDEHLRWIGLYAGWVSLLDKRLCRMGIFAGWVSPLVGPLIGSVWVSRLLLLGSLSLLLLPVSATYLDGPFYSGLLRTQFRKCMPLALVYSHVLHEVRWFCGIFV